MDLTGNYPKLLDDDPLYEIAEYTQIMANTLGSLVTNTITLGSTYTYYGGTYGVPQYSMDANKTVILNGLIGCVPTQITMLANTQYLIGTIPANIRPATDRIYIPATASGMTGRSTFYVRANGNLHFETNVAFSNLPKGGFFIGIDGFNWKAGA